MLFRSRAEDILDMVQRTKTEFSTMDDDIAGDVYIGGAETAAFRCLAEIATKIRETHPRICYHIYSGNYEDMDYRLEKGLLDFVLTLQSVKQDEFDSMKLPDGEIWGVIMRKDNPLAQKKRIRLTDLKEEPLICSREAMREEYPSWFGEEIKNMNIAATFNLLNNAAILAKEGLGVVVGIDRLINNDDGSELCFRPLSPKLVSPLHLIWRKYQHLSPAAELFLKEMKQRYVSDSESYSAL